MADNGGAKSRPDVSTALGMIVAVGGIAGGLFLEGGKWRDLSSPSAALIVLGGTFGAVMVTTPLDVLKRAIKRLGLVFFARVEATGEAIDDIIGFATKARKQGIVALEDEAQSIADPFLRKAMNLAVDGTDLQDLRKTMELEIGIEEQRGEEEAKVFEAAGGYAPTIGIIGAVLGLIQVMKKIQNTDEVGAGIAVAFVATVYGVGSANLFFLPAANKIKARLHRSIQTRELMLEGVVAIVEGLNPKLIRIKLDAFLHEQPGGTGKKGAVRRQEAA
jgi:chemotaxis protein MotA